MKKALIRNLFIIHYNKGFTMKKITRNFSEVSKSNSKKMFMLVSCMAMMLAVCSCKKDATEPNNPTPPLDPDELIELITDTTWFDTCGCLKGTKVDIYPLIEELSVWVEVDTSASLPYKVGNLIYSSNLPEWEREMYLEAGFPESYFSCPFAGLTLNSINSIREHHWICNFPADKIITSPAIFEATISGMRYGRSFTLNTLVSCDFVEYDLLLTSLENTW